MNRFAYFLLLFLTLLIVASGDESETPSVRIRLRRPSGVSKRQSTTTTTSPPLSSSSVPGRSRFRVKSTTTSVKSATAPPLDQELAGSIPSTSKRILSRLKASKLSPVVSDSSSSASGDKDYKIVCYYTNWSQYRPKVGKFLPEDIPADLCTHLIFAFGWMKKGRLSSFEANDETKDGKPGYYERMNNLKKTNPKLQTLLAIGGWSFGTAKFKEMAATRYTRQTFIFSAIPYLRDRNFDGLDIDWEYPKGSDDKKNYVLLLKELKEAFEAEAEETGKPRLLLTAAVPVGPDSIRGGYDVPAVSKYLDWINLMAYDFHGKWESQSGHNAPLYAPSSDSEWRKALSVEMAAKTWVKLGADKSKMVIGMPTYGRSFQLANPANYSVNVATKGGGTAGVYTKEAGFLAYYEICEVLLSGTAIYVWDDEMKVPYYVANDQWVGFDDEKAIRNKMKWIQREGFAGAMVWSIDMDDFTGTACPGYIKYPLIGAMKEELRGSKRSGGDVDWSSIVPTPDDNDDNVSKQADVIDPKQVIEAALKKKKKVSLLKVEEPQTRPPAILCYISPESENRGSASRKFSLDNINPKFCTHLIFAYATLKHNQLQIIGSNDDDDAVGRILGPALKLKEGNPNLKIILSLGGTSVGTKPFQSLTSNIYRLNNFVYSVTEFLRENSVDGLDVAWQFPEGRTQTDAHLNLIKELRLAFEGEAKTSKVERLLLTMTVPSSEDVILNGYSISELAQYVDYVNLLSFDFHGSWEKVVGHHAPLNPVESAGAAMSKLTLSHASNVWISEGLPAEKLAIGMPTFGRTFTLENPEKFDIGSPVTGPGTEGKWTKKAGMLAYFEICKFLQDPNTTLVWDNEQSVPFAYAGDQWVGFDDERSLKAKTEWLKTGGFGGVFLWSLDLDDFGNVCGTNKFPLLGSILQELGEYRVPLKYKGPYESLSSSAGGPSGKKDPNEVTCEEEDGHISYHPDKADCSKYYMCEGERKHHMPCPANLVFNPDQNVCDWTENVASCKDFVKT